MKYKNACKFGLFVKDLGKVINPSEVIECETSSNIQELLKEHKLAKIIDDIKIENKELENTPKKYSNRKDYKKKDFDKKESICLDEEIKEED